MTIANTQTLNLWFSPNFPTGGFAFSHGYDALFGKSIQTETDLRQALAMVLNHGGLRSDLIFLQSAMQGGDLCELNQICYAFCAGRERWEETLTQGNNFAKAVHAVHGLEIPISAYPITVGEAARALGLNTEITKIYYAQNMLSNLAMISARLIPLSITKVNAIIHAMRGEIENRAQSITTLTTDDISSAAFAIDYASLAHETQEIRLCKT